MGTRDITLLPIGGIARLDRMPEKPIQELLIAVAGPAVNVALALALWAVLTVIGSSASLAGLSVAGGSFLTKLMWLNVSSFKARGRPELDPRFKSVMEYPRGTAPRSGGRCVV